MFGECHAHVIMDGINYKAAVALHKDGVCEAAVRAHLKEWKDAGITFVRDGGDARGASKKAKELAPEYGIDYRTPVFAIHKRHHYGGIVGLPFDTWTEYEALVLRAKEEGADFIKIMVSGILDFAHAGTLTEDGLVASRKGNDYTVKDDKNVLEFYLAHKDDSVEDLVHAVCTNTDFWGEDLTALEGFETAVCNYLTQIREKGAYEVMKSLL